MRAKTTAAILVLLPLLILGLVACGTDSGAAASQIDETADGSQSVAIIDDDHDDGDGHETVALDDHDAEATALAEHNETPHDDMVADTHEDEATESHAHAHMDGPVDADAPVMHVFANEFGYETATSEVEAGQPFSIQIHNDGVLEHDITFAGLEDEFGVHVQPGEDDIATFSIHEAGEYVYYCTIPGHRDAGMTGTLSVSSALVAADEDGHDDEADHALEDEAAHEGEPEVLTIDEEPDHAHDEEAQHGDDDHVEGAAGA